MSDETRLSELVRLWHQLRDEGRTLTPQEMCADCPELTPALQKQLQAQALMEAVVAEGEPIAPPASDRTVRGAAGAPASEPGQTSPRSGERTIGAPPSSPPSQGGAGGGRKVVAGYEIHEELGRGGMGVVYKARQLGLNRLVALKMILAGGHASMEHVDRFRREAEAVARLQHPNIVQIHEIGQYEGLPFFSLEYVSGGSLDRKLAGTPQPPGQAASWVITLARAVHAAHQAGIVHRDLKPQNVLITTEGVLKVTDFGLAKQVEGTSSPAASTGGSPFAGSLAAGVLDTPPLTETGVVMGTPSYMAPEQASGNAKLIGPGTDVYALGALLYEMLTGRPPFKAATPIDTVMQVVTEEPVPPRRLQPKVPVDLETICLKCLAKEPGKRYADAGVLADDLQRFLNNEPILARPAPWWERTWKWARRRPTLASLIAVSVIGLIILAMLGGLWLDSERRAAEAAAKAAGEREEQQAKLVQIEKDRAEKEESLRKAADEQRQKAEKSFADAMAAVDRMLTRVSEDKDLLAHEPRMEQIRRKLLEDALEFYQKLLKEKSDDPKVRFETAQAFFRLGVIRQDLGKFAEAKESLDEALALLLPLAQQYPKEVIYLSVLGQCYSALAWNYRERDELDAAEKTYQQALSWQQSLADDYPLVPAFRQQLAQTYNDLGGLLEDVYKSLNRPEEGRKAHEQALAIRKKLAEAFPLAAEYQNDLSQSYHNIGAHLESQQQFKEAEDMFRAAAAIRGKLVHDYPKVPVNRQHLARTLLSLAITLANRGQLTEAEEVLDQALALFERLRLEFPSFASYQEELAECHLRRFYLFQRTAQENKRDKALKEAIDLRRKLVEEHPGVPNFATLLAQAVLERGAILFEQKDISGAKADFEEAIRLDPTYGLPHQNLAWLLQLRGDTEGALAQYQEAIRKNPKLPVAINNRGYLLMQKGELDKAIADFAQALQLQPDFILPHENRGMALHKKGDYQAAIADFTRVIELDPKRGMGWALRGYVLWKKDRSEKAFADLDKAITVDPTFAGAYNIRAYLNAGRKKYAAAVADYEKALDLDPVFAQAHANLGWLLATCPDAKFRDGKKALQAAEYACRLTDWKNPSFMEVLAAAHAELGQFKEAVALQKKALAAPDYPKQDLPAGPMRLKLYEQGQPFRDEKSQVPGET